MRISPIVLLLFAMHCCFADTQPAKPAEKATAAKKPDAATVKKHMTPEQLALGDPIVNSVGMVLVPIPAGQFQMGSSISAEEILKRYNVPAFYEQLARKSLLPKLENEHPQHRVRVTKPFYLSVYEVTQQQYAKVMGVRPWKGIPRVQDGPDYPAVFFSWDDAVAFCRKLSEQEGVEYHLPTEAQWEFACRAGTTTAYSFGNDASKLGQYAWYKNSALDIGERYVHRVGQKLPNPWGLYDMHGNVGELCQDWHAPYGSEKVLSDPMGPAQGGVRVLRGGSFSDPSPGVRSAYRDDLGPTWRGNAIGFRPSRTYP